MGSLLNFIRYKYKLPEIHKKFKSSDFITNLQDAFYSMILHLAWKFVCKLSSSWLLIPQNLLIFSSQLMNNCSDWELFGNNLSCKKEKKRKKKTTTFIGEKKHPY